MTSAPLTTIDRSASAAADPDQWVDRYGDLLLAYAVRQVADRAAAEDLVQETFLAAWRTRDSYRGDAKFETWLVGILRHKACDHLRNQKREGASLSETLASMPDSNPAAESLFDRRGHWRVRPARWSSLPADSVENAEFWLVVQHCLSDLPDHFAEAFRRRLASGETLQQMGQALGISAANLSIRLHRARLLLRTCFEHNWFAETRQSVKSRKA